jgi:hypothetical protein
MVSPLPSPRWIGRPARRRGRRARIDTAMGAARLDQVFQARRKRALHIPYGPRAIHLGLAPPPTWAERARRVSVLTTT